MITQTEVRRLFDYRDGVLYWRVSPATNVFPGGIAGCAKSGGYWHIRIRRRLYKAHRLIFLWHHGWLPAQVDHIKGKSNHVENLRAATGSQNQYNRGLNANNASGVKGVYWDKSRGKWYAQCTVNRTNHRLGRFADLADAESAVRKFRELHHGEFANHGDGCV